MKTSLYIGGQWKDASDSSSFPVIDPSNEQVLAEVASATSVDVNEAIDVAYKAGQEWAKTSPRES